MTARTAFKTAYLLRVSTCMLAAQLSHGRNTGIKGLFYVSLDTVMISSKQASQSRLQRWIYYCFKVTRGSLGRPEVGISHCWACTGI